jgi:hypothetical protein
MKASTLVFVLLTSTSLAATAEWRLTLRAGAQERVGSIVTFAAPKELRGAALLESGDGASVAAQVDDTGRGVFIEPRLASGAVKTYTLKAIGPVPPTLTAEKAGDLLKVSAAGKPIFSYQMEAGEVPEGVLPIFRHGAHLHPVFSPSGRLVTGNHPPDHRWHRGVWMAWTRTEFEGRKPDFWNQGKGEGPDKAGGKLLAEVRFEALELQWSGPVQAGFVSRHRFIDHGGAAPQDVLHELWDVAAYRVNAGAESWNVIDLASTQWCAGASPLRLPKYHYGGLGVRGSQLWNPLEAVKMLTSNGEDRLKGDATKAKWVHLGGEVDGAPTGLAVLIHPANFRFPQPLRLNPKNPQLCVAPSQDGDWEIAPGKPFLSRYRLVVADGAAEAARLERLWADYAEPALAEVGAK